MRLEEALVGARAPEGGGEVPEPRPQEGVHGLDSECDPKHARTLLQDYGVSECEGKETPMTRERVGKSGPAEQR